MTILAAVTWTDKVTAWSTLALAIFAVFGFIGLILTRNAVKEAATGRQAEIILEISDRWDRDMQSIKQTLDGVDATQLLQRVVQAEAENSSDYYDLQRFANYFEHMGTLYKLKCLDLKWIDEFLGQSVVEFWEIWQPTVMRDRPSWPKCYENWELLANEIRKLRSG